MHPHKLTNHVTHTNPTAGDAALELHGDFAWEKTKAPNLHEIDLRVPAGSLVAIVGGTGCGKSTLLAAALGMVEQVRGVVGLGRYEPRCCLELSSALLAIMSCVHVACLPLLPSNVILLFC